ncbi:MAG: hypothetical protein JSS81_05855 [Acidobacteria bacterium]|nr:hypothetical protein [Acidobacteriota bacterium]
MKKNEAQPGDVVELSDKEGGFTDSETGFDISRDQQKKLGDTVGKRTQQAVLSGGLLIVSRGAGKSSAKTSAGTATDESDLPADLPGRDAFVAAGLKFDQVKAMTKDELLAVKGIGAKTVEQLGAWADSNK